MDFKLILISFGTKETIIMSENKQLLDQHEENIDPITDQPDAHPVSTGDDWLAKAAIGSVVGAVVGAVAGALASKVTAKSINHTVKGVGNAVKGAAEGFNYTVKGVADAVKSVAENVNHTLKDTVDVVKGAAEDVNHTLKDTVDAVKGAAEDVNYTVKGAVDAAAMETAENAKQSAKQVDTQTAYILVPVDKEQVVN